MQIRRVKEGGSSQIENNFTIAVHNRATVTAELATRLVNAYSKNRAMKSPEQVRAIDVAARRYLTSLTEVDDVDKYCDLWESCEFSSMFEHARDGKVGKIAQGLASNLKGSGIDVTKAKVETALRVKELHVTRGSVVHQ